MPGCAGGFADPGVPGLSFQYARKEQEDEGRKRYEEQKLDRLETKQRNGDVIFPVINPGNADGVWPTGMSQQCWEAKLVPEAALDVSGHPWLRACAPKPCGGFGERILELWWHLWSLLGWQVRFILSLGDLWGSRSYRKRCPGFWKRGGSAAGELKGRVAGGLQDQPRPRAEAGRCCMGIAAGLMQDESCSNAFFPSVLPAHRQADER